MSSLPADTYLDLVRRSGLVEPERLDSALARLARDGHKPADAEELSDLLAAANIVTPWQNRMLMKGLWRGFFLGRYKLLRELGAGGMSSVYLAEHVLLRRRVAIKVLHQKRAANQSHLTRFYRESRSAAALDHPNIVRVHDFDNDGKFHYLVMEFIEGPNLQELVDARGRLDYVTAAEQIAQAAEGLHFAHQQGLIHRDVKPANLLVTPQNLVKITDFGLAQIRNGDGPSLTLDDGTVLGTVDYLAPEQALDSHAIDTSADVYGLGCTLYFLLTGQPPYPTGTMAVRLVKHQTEKAPLIGTVRFDCPDAISQICTQMMAKQPSARPTADRVAVVLRDWLFRRAGRGSNSPTVLDVATANAVADPHRDTVTARTSLTGTVIEDKPAIPAPVEPPSTVVGHTPGAGPHSEPRSDYAVTTPSSLSPTAPSAADTAISASSGDTAISAGPAPVSPTANPATANPASNSVGNPAAVNSGTPRRAGKIAVRCRHCGALLHAPAAAAGKRAKCPECATVVTIPVNLANASPEGSATVSSVAPAGDPKSETLVSPGAFGVNAGVGLSH